MVTLAHLSYVFISLSELETIYQTGCFTMADCVYIFNKTREKRLEEFKDVLCSSGAPVLVTDVADEWSCTLENFIEPTGWQALWKISRQICEELNIMFPKFVFVRVCSFAIFLFGCCKINF